ncbi:BCD family MFS transporter [Rhizobium sp. WL3]|uniref:BCD family MFS transporter n=1 Tax=Rhizobium sp. WL3 TaxID=2603277 RepID=UPI0011C1E0DA|nr:BCD family MFS transporter [Rhizobium sp. WL3]QEE45147.1 BCD family MFS transporter [Rhizobium sp. WL3]
MAKHRPSIEGLGWFAIIRLGLVQAALGAIVVLTTSTLNRVMIVELGLAAVIPGLLVGLHYGIQITRPVWGHKSDTGRSRTLWIIGGLALLACAGTGAAATTLLFEQSFLAGIIAAVLAYLLIGIGIGASGTSLLALIAMKTAVERRAAAATITWMLMITGIIVTSIVVGSQLDPYSHERLIAITAATGLVAFVVGLVGVAGMESRPTVETSRSRAASTSFRDSLKDVLEDREARLFTVFIFLSMLAFATQDLILEPYAGLLFGMTPGETTSLSGTQHAGVLLGMIMVGLSGALFGKRYQDLPRHFITSGCFGSAVALAALALSAQAAPNWPLQINIFLLGTANGAFAVAAIGTMMILAGRGRTSNYGMRMGIWGAAQAVAFGLGGVLGTVALDLGRWLTAKDAHAFAAVFSIESGLFLISALVATRLGRPSKQYPETMPDTAFIPGE